MGKLDAVGLARFQDLTGLRIESADGGMVDDLPTIQRWLNRILALPIGLQNAIFDEFLGLVEARIDAARAAGTLDLGLVTIAVESFEILSDSLLRTDSVSGATAHLLEQEIARALKPLTLDRLGQLEGSSSSRRRLMYNSRSGRAAVLASGRAMPVKARETLLLKRSLVNGTQRLELTVWSASRLDWYKAKGCFTEIIRFQTRLFVPLEEAAAVLTRVSLDQ